MFLKIKINNIKQLNAQEKKLSTTHTFTQENTSFIK